MTNGLQDLWRGQTEYIQKLELRAERAERRVMELEDELRHYRDPANPAFYQIRWDRNPGQTEAQEA